MARGYAAVTLRDIAAEVGIKHASLYHRVPGGKEELFAEVLERCLDRHRHGLTGNVLRVEPNLRARLHAAAEWFLGQAPMDLVRLTRSDMPELSHESAERLGRLTYESILVPVERILRDARDAGEIGPLEFGLVAGGIVGMIQSLFSVPDYAITGTRLTMGKSLVDVFIDGIAGSTPGYRPTTSASATAHTDPTTTAKG